MNKLGIDCKTKGKNDLIRALRQLKTTYSVDDCGAYQADKSLSMLYIDTEWTEEEMDNWLYKTKVPCDYIGTFKRERDR